MSSATTRRDVACIWACVSAIASPALAQEAAPLDGVASASLCADAYVLELVPEAGITALSWQVDAPVSAAPPWSRSLPQAWPDAARLLTLSPRLTVFGTGEGGRSARLLERAGRPVHELGWASDFDGVRANLRALGAAMGREAEAETAITRLDGRLARLAERAAARTAAPRIVYLSVSGGSAGQDTYIDAAIRAAGGVNVVAEAGAIGWTRGDPEFALRIEADIVLTSFFTDGFDSTFNRARRHSAYRALLDHERRMDVPAGLWACAGPRLIDAAELIADVIDAWEAGG